MFPRFRPPLNISWLDWIKLKLHGAFWQKNRVRNQEIFINCRSIIEIWRCQTYSSKEPETLDWIDGFLGGDVFFDIGANIGVYSLYAAKNGASVFSFEPESQNFSGLVVNSFYNKLTNIKPFCLALSNEQGFDMLSVMSINPGDSQHNLGGANKFYERNTCGLQGIYKCSIDDLIGEYGLPVPQHIKIDVDGLEDLIIEGANKTFSNNQFKSLLIEISSKDDNIERYVEFFNKYEMKLLVKAKRAHQAKDFVSRNYIFSKSCP